MKKLNLILAAIGVALLGSFGAANAASAVTWAASFADAKSQAQSANKLIMVDVYTDWCGWCKKLDADDYTNPAVISAMDAFVPLKANVEKDGLSIANTYDVDSYPTILFLEPDGTLVDKIEGYEPPDQFAADLARIDAENKAFPVLQAAVKLNPQDMPSAAKLASAYIKRGDTTDAKALVAIMGSQGDKTLLAPIYNQLGDSESAQSHWTAAAAWYAKAAAASSDLTVQVDAHAGLAQCDMEQGLNADAKAELTKILALPGLSSDLGDRVKAAIAQIA